MKAFLRTVFGLIVDDWWLVDGIIISIVIAYLALKFGMNPSYTGWLLLLLIIGTLLVSLQIEFRKKTKL